VSFAPSASGLRNATLTVAANGGPSQSAELSGGGVPAGVYFRDDFESGSLAQWDALASPDATIALDTGTANSGAASVRLTNGSPDTWSRLSAELAGGPHASTYTRFCFLIGAGVTKGIEIANGRAITAEYPLGIRRWEITYNAVTQGLEGYFFNDALQRLDLFAGNGRVEIGRWHCAELYLDEAVDGRASLSLDGNVIDSVYGDLSTPDPYERLYLWNQPSADSVWFDDVEVTASPVGGF
jgi:hypothetical protein